MPRTSRPRNRRGTAPALGAQRELPAAEVLIAEQQALEGDLVPPAAPPRWPSGSVAARHPGSPPPAPATLENHLHEPRPVDREPTGDLIGIDAQIERRPVTVPDSVASVIGKSPTSTSPTCNSSRRRQRQRPGTVTRGQHLVEAEPGQAPAEHQPSPGDARSRARAASWLSGGSGTGGGAEKPMAPSQRPLRERAATPRLPGKRRSPAGDRRKTPGAPPAGCASAALANPAGSRNATLPGRRIASASAPPATGRRGDLGAVVELACGEIRVRDVQQGPDVVGSRAALEQQVHTRIPAERRRCAPD
jgi:hypothetical protein